MRGVARKDERKKATAGEIPTVAEGVICQLSATLRDNDMLMMPAAQLPFLMSPARILPHLSGR